MGIILILLGIPLTTFILSNQAILKSGASGSQEPKNIRITNISDKSFTIAYQTDTLATGSISYGVGKNLGESALEDIDREKGSFSPRIIHSISVNELTSTTKYYLTIISGDNTFLNSGAPFETTTGPNISSPSAQQNSINGKVVLPDGNIPSEGIAFLNTENSQLLSSIIAKDGKFNFSLKELRTSDLSSYLDINQNTVFKIMVTNGPLKSNILTSLTQIDSIPTITLSNDYDFTEKGLPVASKSAQSLGFPPISPTKENSKPEILSPKENQSVVDPKPQFSGTSLPNEKVDIIIHSAEEISTQVTTDSNGNWTYKPPTNLSPGAHTITIKSRDSSGILTTVMQSFTVFAADSQTSGSATPSATPTTFPTIAPISSITPTLTVSPTVVITPFPSPTNPIIPTTLPTLPPTGNSAISTVGFMGVITTVIGLFTLFFVR